MAALLRRFAAPAKINLGLRIVAKRPDGYHAIQTILQMIDLCDWLCFRPQDEATIRLTCLPPVLPTDDTNLVVQAAKLLQQTFRVPHGVEITLAKRIPVAAGLGGGSSDAGTTLLVLNRMWQLHQSKASLHSIALQLGSDVPFFLEGPTAYACGRGDLLSPITPPPPLTGILVNPGFAVSAGWAYGQFNGPSAATERTLPLILQALLNHDLVRLADLMVNDLQPGVARSYPVIGQAQAALQAVGAMITFMSGSGPTVGGIFPSAVDLPHAVATLRRHAGWTVMPFTTLSESVAPELRG